MLKQLQIVAFIAACSVAIAQDTTHHKVMHDEHQVHHAAIHAEHWLNHHLSAPHKVMRRRRRPIHRSKTVHHAVMHAERWIDHHVSAPHQTGGN